MAPAALTRGPEGASLGEQRGGRLWVGVPSRPAAGELVVRRPSRPPRVTCSPHFANLGPKLRFHAGVGRGGHPNCF